MQLTFKTALNFEKFFAKVFLPLRMNHCKKYAERNSNNKKETTLVKTSLHLRDFNFNLSKFNNQCRKFKATFDDETNESWKVISRFREENYYFCF